MNNFNEMSKVDVGYINNFHLDMDSDLSDEQVEQRLTEQALLLINRRCDQFSLTLNDQDKLKIANCLVEQAKEIRDLQSEIYSRFSLVAAKYKVVFESK